MPRKGWIKLHHSLLDNEIWTKTPFSEGQAWVDILLMASYERHEVGADVYEPGTVRTSKEYLMKRWGWTRWKIDKVLNEWEQKEMLQRTNQRTNQRTLYTVLTVVKWDFFQGEGGKNQRTNQRTNRQEHKNIYKKGDGERLSRRPARVYNAELNSWEVVPVDE